MLIYVRGKTGEWVFKFDGDAANLAEWRADGLDVYEAHGEIPAWAFGCGLAAPWLAAQRLWQWMRLW